MDRSSSSGPTDLFEAACTELVTQLWPLDGDGEKAPGASQVMVRLGMSSWNASSRTGNAWKADRYFRRYGCSGGCVAGRRRMKGASVNCCVAVGRCDRSASQPFWISSTARAARAGLWISAVVEHADQKVVTVARPCLVSAAVTNCQRWLPRFVRNSRLAGG